jgi:hypothetical protein
VLLDLPDAPPMQREFETCADLSPRSIAEFDFSRFIGDQAALDALLARAPTLQATRRDARFDLRLSFTRPDGEHVYEANGVGIGEAAARFTARDAAPPLAWRVSVAAATIGKPMLALQAKEFAPRRLVEDIARAQGVALHHPERLDRAPRMSFDFEMIPVDAALSMVGEFAGQSLTRADDGSIEVGAMRDYPRMVALRNTLSDLDDDPDALRAALERIVALAEPDDAADRRAPVTLELDQLARIALEAKDPERAEHWWRRQLEALERDRETDLSYYRDTLVELGVLRLERDDPAGAETLLARALDLFAQGPAADESGPAASPQLRALRGLVTVRVGQQRYAEAAQLWQQVAAMRAERLGDEHPLTIDALMALALLQRCAADDADARGNEARIAAARARGVPESATYGEDDDYDVEYMQYTRLWLAPLLSPGNPLLPGSGGAETHESLARHECLAEAYAMLGIGTAAAVLYEAALAARVALQGAAHPQVQRSGRRAIELLGPLGPDAEERVRLLLREAATR